MAGPRRAGTRRGPHRRSSLPIGGGALFAAVCLAVLTPLRGFAQAQEKPQFRTGVDLTRVEVTVLDKRTRKPISGLTPADFVVRVSGDVQRVASLAEVSVPSTSS